MISVILPTYNRAATIERAIDSVLNQTYSDIEVIVVDDGSSDNTGEIIQGIRDERLRYIKNTENKGACAARNIGIISAKGEYIAFQDSDDIWHRDKLEKQLKVIQITNADVVFCKRNIVKKSGIYKDYLRQKEGFISEKESVLKIGTQVIFGKTSIFKEISFDERLPRLQDCEILYRIHERYTIYCEDKVLVDYYDSDDAISASPGKLLQACEIILKIHPELKRKSGKTAYEIADLLISSVRQLDGGDKELRKAMQDMAFKYCKSTKVLIKSFLLILNITWEKDRSGRIRLRKWR